MIVGSESMIDKVARALCELHIRRVRRHDTAPERLEEMLPAAVDHNWREHVDEARAALQALMEPTPGMIEASCHDAVWDDADNRLSADISKCVWQAMIRSAMEGE